MGRGGGDGGGREGWGEREQRHTPTYPPSPSSPPLLHLLPVPKILKIKD